MKMIFKILCIPILLLCSGCLSTHQTKLEKDLHVSFANFQELEYQDDHGWFGDGITYIIASCDNIEFMDRSWNELPLNASLYSTIYDDVKLPVVKKGYYYFKNRSPSNSLLTNYTFALYDTSTNQFYYIKSDS